MSFVNEVLSVSFGMRLPFDGNVGTASALLAGPCPPAGASAGPTIPRPRRGAPAGGGRVAPGRRRRKPLSRHRPEGSLFLRTSNQHPRSTMRSVVASAGGAPGPRGAILIASLLVRARTVRGPDRSHVTFWSDPCVPLPCDVARPRRTRTVGYFHPARVGPHPRPFWRRTRHLRHGSRWASGKGERGRGRQTCLEPPSRAECLARRGYTGRATPKNRVAAGTASTRERTGQVTFPAHRSRP